MIIKLYNNFSLGWCSGIKEVLLYLNLDISEDEMAFFESTIQNLDILDTRKGKHVNDIHSYNEGEEGLIY